MPTPVLTLRHKFPTPVRGKTLNQQRSISDHKVWENGNLVVEIGKIDHNLTKEAVTRGPVAIEFEYSCLRISMRHYRSKKCFPGYVQTRSTAGDRRISNMVTSNGCREQYPVYSRHCSGDQWVNVRKGSRPERNVFYSTKPVHCNNKFSVLGKDEYMYHQRDLCRKSNGRSYSRDYRRDSDVHFLPNQRCNSKKLNYMDKTSFKGDDRKHHIKSHSPVFKKACKSKIFKKKINDTLQVQRNLLCHQVKPELLHKIQDVHKELNQLVGAKKPSRVLTADSTDFEKDQTLSTLVNMLDKFMDVGLSHRARQKYLCKWCLYSGNSYCRVKKYTDKSQHIKSYMKRGNQHYQRFKNMLKSFSY